MDQVVNVAVNYPLYQTFDYLVPSKLGKATVGGRVLVPFGKKTVIGVVVKREKRLKSKETNYILKPIKNIIDQYSVIDSEMMKVCLWASDYYEYPLGQVIFATLPSQVKRGIAIKDIKIFEDQCKKTSSDEMVVNLNDEQNSIFKKILRNIESFSTSLIYGVTGSGKTEIYVKLAKEIIKKDKQVLIIVPEINLTPQTISRFKIYIDKNIQSYHSGHTLKRKMTTWLDVQNKKVDIIIGTRSSIFLPFKSLGLIIIDEEHDTSLKQQEMFRYHARDLSIIRAKNLNIPIIIGSATPSFESLYNAQLDKYKKYNLTKRYYKTDLPRVTLVDLNKDLPDGGISKLLKSEIMMNLDKKNKLFSTLGDGGLVKH